MSIRVMTEVWKTNLATTEKMVLLVIADHANEDGTEAWPSQATIATKCSITVRTVQRCIRTLVQQKYIYVQKRAGGSIDCREDRRPNRYTINLTRLRGDKMTGRHNDQDGATIAPATGRHTRPMNHPQDPSIEPSLFDTFWQIYPKRVAKGAAQKAWATALKSASAQDIIAGATRYAQDRKRDPNFTAHPATWLNAQRWLDEAPTAQEVQATATPQPPRFDPAEYEHREAVPMPKDLKKLINALRK